VALAHLICGDGSVHHYGLIICTDAYSIQDVARLMNVLIVKYNLDCTIIFHGPNYTHPRIYIRAKSIAQLRSIVLPFTPISMQYKLFNGRVNNNDTDSVNRMIKFLLKEI